jgi:hypothetical protein
MMWAAISLEKMALLPVERVFPEHHSLDIQPDEGCFPGIEGERETASWERNF